MNMTEDKETKSTLISMKISVELLNKIKKEAEEKEISYSALIRLILKNYYKD